MRVTSDFWVSAFLRRCSMEGAFAVVQRRGDAQAGAIFVIVDDMRGTCSLYGGASQSLLEDADGTRYFTLIEGPGPCGTFEPRLAREVGFDPDAWILAVEDQQGRHFLELR